MLHQACALETGGRSPLGRAAVTRVLVGDIDCSRSNVDWRGLESEVSLADESHSRLRRAELLWQRTGAGLRWT